MKRTVYVPLIVMPPVGDAKGPSWSAFPATYAAEDRGVPVFWTLEDAMMNAREWVWHTVKYAEWLDKR